MALLGNTPLSTLYPNSATTLGNTPGSTAWPTGGTLGAKVLSTTDYADSAPPAEPLFPLPTPTAGYFCSPSGSAGGAGTTGDPLTFTAALNKAEAAGAAGKVITLMTGTYTFSTTRTFGVGTSFDISGSSGGGRCVIRGAYNGDVEIRNTTSDATPSWQLGEGLGWTGIHHVEFNSINFEGLSLSGPGIDIKRGCHHIVIANCNFRNSGKAHISFHGTDYMHVDRCTFAVGGQYTGGTNFPSSVTYHFGGGGGGPSGGNLRNRFDTYTGFHNFFTNNIITAQNDPEAAPTDGNGWIYDNPSDEGDPSSASEPAGIHPPCLVANNLVYLVGGRGFNLYGAHGGPFFMVNNTVYKVACDTDNPGFKGSFIINNASGDKVYYINNISYSFNGKVHFSFQGTSNNSSRMELHTNFVYSQDGTPDYNNMPAGWDSDPTKIIAANPLFNGTLPVSSNTAANQHLPPVALDPYDVADVFKLQPTSPCIDAGVDPRDYMGNANLIADYETVCLLDLAAQPRPN